MMNYRASKTFVWMIVMLALLMGLLTGCTEPPSPTNVTASAAPTTQRPTAAPTAIPTQPPMQPTQPATQPTQPAPQPTEPPAPENPVPEALRNNYYLGSKGYGACAEMTGNIHLLIVFVSDSISKWTEGDILETKNAFADHETKLEEAATQRGAEMDVSMSYLEATISTEFRDDGKVLTSAYTTMRKLGMGDAFYDQDSLEEQYGANAVPILFVLNRQGRAFAVAVDAQTESLECAVIFSKDMSSVRHELYHIFGAQDFYFPDETVAAQEKYLPDSVMNNHFKDVVDDLTAFLIGWVDELSDNAIKFLQATNHLTKEEIEDARAEN